MNRTDFVRVTGADSDDADYLPVACLLRSGYGCAGYFNQSLNEALVDTVVLVNARLVELRSNSGPRASITDFSDFIQEVVQRSYTGDAGGADAVHSDFGAIIPLAAIPLSEIAVVYPVAQIEKMSRRLTEEEPEVKIPAFLDLQNRSIVLKILRTKLW